MTPSRPGTGADPGRATAAACAGVFAVLFPKDAGADPDEDFFAIADLASTSFARDRSVADSAGGGGAPIVDKSELRERDAFGAMVSASLSSPWRIELSGVWRARCVRIHSPRSFPYVPQACERRPGASP